MHYISIHSSEAQSRVEEMEKERKKLDKQLDHALEKAKAANHGQEVLETKIKVSMPAHFGIRNVINLPVNQFLKFMCN